MSRDMTLTQLLALSTERPRRAIRLFWLEREIRNADRDAEMLAEAQTMIGEALRQSHHQIAQLNADAAQLRRSLK